MTFTRLADRFPTREEAERAARWAARYSVRVPLQIHRHECEKLQHQTAPWLLLCTVAVEEPERGLAAALSAIDGRR